MNYWACIYTISGFMLWLMCSFKICGSVCVHVCAYKSGHTINERSSPASCSWENACCVILHSLGIAVQPSLQEDGTVKIKNCPASRFDLMHLFPHSLLCGVHLPALLWNRLQVYSLCCSSRCYALYSTVPEYLLEKHLKNQSNCFCSFSSVPKPTPVHQCPF